MTKSAVYFTDFHATPNETLPQKLHRLMKRVGFETIDFTDRYAAIKIHFGELGNLASFDPVALDQACADLCNKMPVIEGSRLDQHIKSFGAEDPNHDYFHLNHPDTEWEAGIIHAEEIGLGSRQYELVQI